MSDRALNKGPQDIGGQPAGPVDTTDHGMRFWERQANAFRSTVQARGITCTDELRRAAEDLGDEYNRLEYFEITTRAMRTVLLEKSIFTEQELVAKMAEIRARFDVPDEMQSSIKKKPR
jgi:nitrile hydratase beta subunit-like protein